MRTLITQGATIAILLFKIINPTARVELTGNAPTLCAVPNTKQTRRIVVVKNIEICFVNHDPKRSCYMQPQGVPKSVHYRICCYDFEVRFLINYDGKK